MVNNLMPLVSVIIPVYNSEKFLEATLQSVLGQSWQNIEIVLVDDGSTDGSYEIARKFEGRNCKVVRTNNMGACAARNIGVSVSTGDFIQFLDADDLLSQTKIENQLKVFSQYGNDIVVSCKWVPFSESDSLSETMNHIPQLEKDYERSVDWLIDSWNGMGMGVTGIWLIPREVVAKAGNWEASLLKNQDGEYFTRILLNSVSVRYATDCCLYYRKEGGKSISSYVTMEKVVSQIHSIDLMAREMRKHETSSRVEAAVSVLYFGVLYHYYHKFPEIMYEVYKKIPDKSKYVISKVGSPSFRYVAAIAGFKTALRIDSFARKLRKIVKK